MYTRGAYSRLLQQLMLRRMMVLLAWLITPCTAVRQPIAKVIGMAKFGPPSVAQKPPSGFDNTRNI